MKKYYKHKGKCYGYANKIKTPFGEVDFYPGYDEEPYVHLETFIIAKEHQNKGVGTFLFQKTIEQIKAEGCLMSLFNQITNMSKKSLENVDLPLLWLI